MRRVTIIISIIIISMLSVLLIIGAVYTGYFDSQTKSGMTTSGVPKILASEKYPGGEGTVGIKPFPSFMKPAANLDSTKVPDFHAGKALAHQPWVKPPTITFDRDGLGPIYNARTCLMCHVNGGRGVMPKDESQHLNTALLRLSIPGTDKIKGVVPEPTYGDQLQTQSVSLAHIFRHLKNQKLKHSVPPEAILTVSWLEQDFQYPDGSVTKIRKPKVNISELGYGEMHPDTMMGLRNAPPIHGLGLLEMIPQASINALVDEKDRNHDGISGKLNQVWDFEAKKTVPGRFGLKANKASVRLQTAGAFHGDMGISNPVFPEQPCTENQQKCLKQRDGNDEAGTEIPENQLQLVVDFVKNIGVPKRRNANHPDVIAGRSLFYQSGCADCHHPSFVTGKSKEYPHLSNQTIWPYSDLLLHDMGEDLADGRPDYLADGNEWRTPPLWGIGLSKKVNGAQNFLHDGRARTIEEAILWHGGEAKKSMLHFSKLDKEDRERLIKFVESL